MPKWIFQKISGDQQGERQPSCPYKALSFQTLRHPQFLSNFKSPKFKFSVSGRKNVRLFDVMTKKSVLSEKNVPLPNTYVPNNLLCTSCKHVVIPTVL